MPVFNVEKYVGNAISSIKKQTYSHWELLIVDDGSNDKTEEIINGFEDSKIRYYKQDNQGVSAARNIGLQNMVGDYFCFLDADDVFPKDSLESRFCVFKQNARIEFVDGRVDFFNKHLSKKCKSWLPKFEGNPIQDLLSLSGKCFFGNTWMIKRKSDKVYQFKEGLTHGEDLLFYINLARQGGLYSYTKDTILHYRTGHQSAMRNLKGLEQGYIEIYNEIKNMSDISDHLKMFYYKKAKGIILKSFLGEGQPFRALKAYLTNWDIYYDKKMN